MNSPMFRWLIAVALVLSVGLATVTPANAQDAAATPAFTVSAEPGSDPATTAQGYFVYQLHPGERATGAVHLFSSSDRKLTIDLDPVDAGTAQGGGSSYALRTDTPAKTGSWLRMNDGTVNLKTGKERLVEFTVSVPKTATPGQYLAGIAIEARSEPGSTSATPISAAGGSGVTIDMHSRYVVAVLVNVPGKWRSSLTIDGSAFVASASGSAIVLDLTNSGVTLLRPNGTILVADADGKQIISAPLRIGTIVPGTSTNIVLPWVGNPPAGDYMVSADLAYSDDGSSVSYQGVVHVTAATAASGATITTVEVTAAGSSSGSAPRFADVAIAISNGSDPIPNVELTLRVERDGELIETFPLANAMTLPAGDSQVHQRYVPPTGWKPGTWTFVVEMASVDPSSGARTILASKTADGRIDVR